MSDIDTILQEEAVSQGVDAHLPLLRKLVSAESGGKPDATSPKGAMGVMQLMPDTAKGLGVTDPYDVRQNIRGGVKYWKSMLDRYDGDPVLASAAYNAGPGNVDKHGGIPPFKETVNYINKLFGKVSSIFSPAPKDVTDDDAAPSYIVRRQAAHEEGSEANKLLSWYESEHGQKAKAELQSPSKLPEEELPASPELARIPGEQQTQIANQLARTQDLTPQQAETNQIPTAQQEALQNPWIDPVNVAAGFGGGAVAMGGANAARALLGNIAGEILGGTIGQTLEQHAPKWAWVGALAVDVATGMAVDKAIQSAAKRIRLYRPELSDGEAIKAAQGLVETPEVQQALESLKTIPPEQLKEQQGILSKIADGINTFVADESGSMPAPKKNDKNYHGTSKKIEFIEEYINSPSNLYGPGFYTTDNVGIAESYTKKGKGKFPTVYEVSWSGEKTPNIIDIEKQADDNLLRILEDQKKYNEYLPSELTGKPIKQIYQEMRNNMRGEGLTADHASEIMSTLSEALMDAGYDGFLHVGGSTISKSGTKHNVTIYFDPKNINIQEIKNTKIYPPKPELPEYLQPKMPDNDIIPPKIQTVDVGEAKPIDLTPITGRAGSPIVEIAESKGRIGGKFARQRKIDPATDDQVKQFLTGDFPDLPTDKAININLNRIESPDDIKETISKISQMYSGGIQEARRHTISLEQTQKLADDMGMTVENLLKRRSGASFNAEEAVAARQILVASATELKSMATKVMGPEATEIDMTAFRKQLAVHAAIQEQVSGMTAEAGRALSSFRIMAQGNDAITKQINEMLTMTGGMKSAKDIANALNDFDTLQQVNQFAQRAYKAKTSDVLLEAWINALLSGPKTHIVNTASNALTAIWQIPERYLAAGIGKMAGTEGAYLNEATSQAYGMIAGIKDALRLAGKALASGESSDTFSKVDIPRPHAISKETFDATGVVGQAIDLLGNIVRMPSRFLTAEDEFFKGIGYRMELQAQAYRQARGEGLTGSAMANRIMEVINDPPEHISAAAIDAARYQTFTKPLGEFGQSVASSVNKLPVLRLIMPFITTPANIFKFTMERTPLAPLFSEVRADILAGGARRDMAISRMSLGSAVMAATASMAAGGQITGRGPIDPELNANMRRTGWQPYSVKFGEKYMSYNRFEPLGSLLGQAADFAEISGQIGEEDAGKLAAATVMSIAKNVTSKTFLRGLSDFMAVMDNPDRQGVKYLQSLTGTVVPTGVAQLAQSIDPVRRETRGQERTGEVDKFGKVKTESSWLSDNIRSRLPGYSQDLPPARNLWGDKIFYPPGLGPDLISPIRVSEKIKSPIDEEMIRNDIKVSMPAKQINGIPLNAQEYDRYVVLSGSGAEERLNKLVGSPEYQRLSDGPDGGKAWMIRKYIQVEREVAQGNLFKEFPELKDIVIKHETHKTQRITGK